MIPYGWHHLDEEDIAAVSSVLRGGLLTQGEEVGRFEEAFARRCRVAHAVACNSATAGLILACRALDLGPGDRLWTSPLSFVASASCALHCGATVDFVDIDPLSGNLSIPALEAKLQAARRNASLPKVVVVVHFAGRPCALDEIARLADEFGFVVVEDAAHACGADYQGEPVGSCRYSSATVFSFHPVKLITTGEGGMVTCRDRQLAERMQRLRSHGIERREAFAAESGPGGWYYEAIELGYNFRLTDFQAALGRSQLRHLDRFVARRRALALRYHQRLSGLPLTLPQLADDGHSAWHLYVVQVAAQKRRRVYDRMRAGGVAVAVHYIPLYRQPLFAGSGTDYPGCECYYAGALTLPLYPDLQECEQEQVIERLGEALTAE